MGRGAGGSCGRGAEWIVSDGGGLQLVLDGRRAGKALATIGVDDAEKLAAELRGRGLEAALAPQSGRYRLVQVKDPDGNQLTFAQDTERGAK